MTSVSISKCNSYNIKEVQSAVNNCLDSLGGISSLIKQGDRVLIKPNILLAKAPEEAITTHPSLIEAIINVVKEVGAVPLVGDSPGGLVGNVGKHWEITGIEEVCNRLGAKILNFEAGGVYEKEINGNQYHIAKPVLDADFIINVPKIKTHSHTMLTCAIKNMYGTVPGLTKVDYHRRAPKPLDFAKVVVDLFALTKPNLNIVDGVIGMEGSGASSGDPRKLGMILASTDAVAVDSLICYILGEDHLTPVNKNACERGLGEADITKIEIKGYQPELVTDFKWPSIRIFPLDKIPSLKPAIDPKICTKCGRCVENCPMGALSVNAGVPEFNYPECITCMCCSEMCPEKAIKLENSPSKLLLND